MDDSPETPRSNEVVHMPGGWRFDKTFNLGHVLTVGAILGPVFIWGSTVESRLSVVERMQVEQGNRADRNMVELKDRMDRDRMAVDAAFRDVKDWLRAIRDEVARKQERIAQ